MLIDEIYISIIFIISIILIYFYEKNKTIIRGGEKENEKIKHIDDNNMSIIMNQLSYIIKQNNDIKNMYTKNRYKDRDLFINKSYSDIYEYI